MQIGDVAHESQHMRRGLIVWLVSLVTSVLGTLLAVHWWHEAFAPMTAERYAALCGNHPECYPEWGYLFGAWFAGLFVMCLSVGLALGVLWWLDSRLLGSAVEKPSDRA